MSSSTTQSQVSSKKNAPSSKSRNAPSTDRGRMIAEAAYYHAEQRGFSGGDQVQDWLDAEKLIDQMSMGTKRKAKA
jgi:Protein of unknown function (DUF2934)